MTLLERCLNSVLFSKEVCDPSSGPPKVWVTPADAQAIIDLVEALEPFASIGIPDNWPGECVLTWDDRQTIHDTHEVCLTYLPGNSDGVGVKIKAYREARKALTAVKGA